MKKVFFKQGLLIGIVAFGFASAAPMVAQAHSGHAEEARVSVQGQQTDMQTSAEERKAAAQTRLADAKLKACQNREKAITNIMTRLGDRGQKQIDLFNTITERTEKFYTNKGKILTNYDALVADVAAKKTAAQSTVDTVKSTSVEFKCDGSDPKGVVATFKDSLKAEIAAMKAYRTSIKNLIVGVKSVQGATSSTSSKEATNEGAQ